MSSLTEEFSRRFEVAHVYATQLRREVYRARYRVLCQQLRIPGFEAWRFPDGEERDHYDDRSVHCVLRQRPTGAVAGAVRLVLCDPTDIGSPFPLETHCENQLGCRPRVFDGVPRRQIAEISRLFLAGPIDAARGRERFPYPILGLLKAVFEMSTRHGVTHVYAMMEPQLNRLLRLFALDFEEIGPVIDCHGRRQPHAADGHRLLERARCGRPRVWEFLTGQSASERRVERPENGLGWAPAGATA